MGEQPAAAGGGATSSCASGCETGGTRQPEQDVKVLASRSAWLLAVRSQVQPAPAVAAGTQQTWQLHASSAVLVQAPLTISRLDSSTDAAQLLASCVQNDGELAKPLSLRR